jgi:hypothetical protein
MYTKIIVGNFERQRPRKIIGSGWYNNVKMDVKETLYVVAGFGCLRIVSRGGLLRTR